MSFILVSIYIGLYSLVVIPPLPVFSVHFFIAFRSFGFSCHFFNSLFLLQVQYFSAFITCCICIFGERCFHHFWQKVCWVSVIYTLFQHTFCRLWTGTCLLVKYYIRPTRIFVIFWVNFGCVCVRFNLINFSIFLYFYFKGCVRYMLASLFCMSKREYLWIEEKCFLFHFKSSFHSWDN